MAAITKPSITTTIRLISIEQSADPPYHYYYSRPLPVRHVKFSYEIGPTRDNLDNLVFSFDVNGPGVLVDAVLGWSYKMAMQHAVSGDWLYSLPNADVHHGAGAKWTCRNLAVSDGFLTPRITYAVDFEQVVEASQPAEQLLTNISVDYIKKLKEEEEPTKTRAEAAQEREAARLADRAAQRAHERNMMEREERLQAERAREAEHGRSHCRANGGHHYH